MHSLGKAKSCFLAREVAIGQIQRPLGRKTRLQRRHPGRLQRLALGYHGLILLQPRTPLRKEGLERGEVRSQRSTILIRLSKSYQRRLNSPQIQLNIFRT